MTIAVKHLRRQVRALKIDDWVRILAVKHRATPTGAGFGSSRFSSPSGAFRVLYAADGFPTAFAEAVVRDRFIGRTHRYLYRPHLEGLCATALTSDGPLNLLDMTSDGAFRSGVDTDAKGARDHLKGQAFSEEVYAQMPEVDGIIFDSRLSGAGCVAIYDRALHHLGHTPPVGLLQVADLSSELTRLGITVRRKRGTGSI